MNEIDQIELLKLLIKDAPTSSILKVNGFYSEFISYDNFKKIFPTLSNSDRIKTIKYIIPLESRLRNILTSILEKEREKFIYELTHFYIDYNGETVLTSYDNMEIIQIKSNIFLSEEYIRERFKSLEIHFTDDEISKHVF